MANKDASKVTIVKARFKEASRAKGLKMKDLGALTTNDRDRSEKTISRYINSGKIPFDLLDRIAERLDVHPNFLMGKYDMAEVIDDEDLKRRLQSFVTPERYPYALTKIQDVKVDQYYFALLAIHTLSLEQFVRIAPEQRFALQHEIENALVPILMKYFPRNVHGEDGFPNYYEFDSQINSIEKEYHRFGLDYWTELDYHKKIRAREAEQLANWE